VLLAVFAHGPALADDAALRVCVDPDNLPYSHADGRGYEPALAQWLAAQLHRPLQLQWQPLRRGLVRKTLGAGVCDVLLTVPQGLERVLTTRPYYRSGYVFATRADDPAPLASFSDPRLATLRIGVQLVGDDGAASPPGHVLARYGAVQHVVGYTVDGGSAADAGAPAGQRIAQALQRHELDAALVWGPQIGWYAAQVQPPLQLQPAQPPADARQLPFSYAMALAVRRGDTGLRDALQAALEARRADIDALLRAHGVPLLPLDATP
jgi:quinoprotein dehydrogenase-associated probable ABC transporter substrate-binding protein